MQRTDVNGNPLAGGSYDYDAFGNAKGDYDIQVSPFGYCGEYTDKESGLVYLRNRYYEPRTGAFTQEDPIRDGANWYGYCGGNPTAFTDPMGLEVRVEAENDGVKEDMRLLLEQLTRGSVRYDPKDPNRIQYRYESDSLQESSDLLLRLIQSEHTITIYAYYDDGSAAAAAGEDSFERFSTNSQDEDAATNGTGASSDILFVLGPTAEVGVRNPDGSLTSETLEQYILLGHELIHADRIAQGIVTNTTAITYSYSNGGLTQYERDSHRLEEYYTIGVEGIGLDVGGLLFSSKTTENKLRQEHGLRPRVTYGPLSESRWFPPN